jgi:hypothetical protein
VVVAIEAGTTLGSLGLPQGGYERLHRHGPVLSLRIDDHPETDGWRQVAPDATVTNVREFRVPPNPVVVPTDALLSNRAFSEWVRETHGALGRLLLTNQAGSWWLVNEPDLELTLLCGQEATVSGLLPDESIDKLRATPVGSWVPVAPTPTGVRRLKSVAQRYGLRPPAFQ